MEYSLYPFTAIVGQEKMKLALILNIINPSLGGVLIRGEKGTAKSTAVRSLAELLPEREQTKGCQYACNPAAYEQACDACKEKIKQGNIEMTLGKMKVIELPVSATEDRVVGSIDIEHAIQKGEKKFEKGILAEANRNILYVDEVNLLEDHIVDLLLDSAAMGVNSIEREGISFSHPAKFTLVGTMNPEEGDLRPQLLDRFGLVVDVKGEEDTSKRVEVIKRRIKFEQNKTSFIKIYQTNQQELSERIVKAKTILEQVEIEDKWIEKAAEISIQLGVDGHRADIVMIKTAMTIAAYEGRTYVVQKDLKTAAELALPHRMRKMPFDDSHEMMNSVLEVIGTQLADKNNG